MAGIWSGVLGREWDSERRGVLGREWGFWAEKGVLGREWGYW